MQSVRAAVSCSHELRRIRTYFSVVEIALPYPLDLQANIAWDKARRKAAKKREEQLRKAEREVETNASDKMELGAGNGQHPFKVDQPLEFKPAPVAEVWCCPPLLTVQRSLNEPRTSEIMAP